MRESQSVVWLSAHVGVDCGLRTRGCDGVITRVLRPFVDEQRTNGSVSRWFFVRYRDGGDHVRLRLLAAARDSKRVERELIAHAQASRVVTKVDWVDYEPELDRYGGPYGIEVAEKFFHISSDVAALLVEGDGELPRPARLGRGLACMLLIVGAFCDTRRWAAGFLRTYANLYLRGLGLHGERLLKTEAVFNHGFTLQEQSLVHLVRELWAGVRSGATTPAGLEPFHVSLVNIRREFEVRAHAGLLTTANRHSPDYWMAVGTVVPSYVHMMSNRLGLSIPEEAYLAHLAALALQENDAERQ